MAFFKTLGLVLAVSCMAIHAQQDSYGSPTSNAFVGSSGSGQGINPRGSQSSFSGGFSSSSSSPSSGFSSSSSGNNGGFSNSFISSSNDFSSSAPSSSSNGFSSSTGSNGFSSSSSSNGFSSSSSSNGFSSPSSSNGFSSSSNGFSSSSNGFSSGSNGFSSGSNGFSSSSGSSSSSNGFSSGAGSFGGSSNNFGGSSSSFGGSSSGSLGGRGGSNSGRRGSSGAQGGIDFSQGTRRPDGKLCVSKESNVETLAREPILECTHKNVEKCHYTYKTQFKPAQEEVCEENFEKLCQITFRQQATRQTVKKCYRPQQKVCNGQGPEECRTVYESSCTTRYIEKRPGKFVGDTQCEKLPVEICGAGCVVEEGPEECHDKEIDSLVDVPEEVCDLNPQKTCRFQTRLVPSLKPEPECTIVPQETCNLKFSSPRRESKPLRSEWCLDDSPPIPDETYDERNAQGAILQPRNN